MKEILDKYDIIIQAGQSNAEGSGWGPVCQENIYMPCSNVLCLTTKYKVQVDRGKVLVEYPNTDFMIEIAQERTDGEKKWSDFSLSFAKQYVSDGLCRDGRKVLIIRCGVGGTSFTQNHWGLQDVCYLQMIKMVDYALQLNESNRVVAFLWHQGESDAINQSKPREYFHNLSAMLSDVRAKYGNIPFIAGDFVPDWKNKNLNICTPIIQEISRVVANNDLCAFVETDGLLSNNEQVNNGDDIHFCRDSLYRLGYRYYKAYSEIQKER